MVPKRVPESARGCVEVEVALLVLLLVAQDVHGDAGHLGSRNLARIKFLRDFQLFFPSKETYFSFVQLYFLGKGQKKSFQGAVFGGKRRKKKVFLAKRSYATWFVQFICIILHQLFQTCSGRYLRAEVIT